MARLPRLHVPGAMYHVVVRGNHRQDIFLQRADRDALDDIMADALKRTGARLHAYCWMTNHLHLLPQVGEQPLGALMQRVGSRFARLVQKSVPTTGHLFENRYRALLVDADSYLLQLIRYIHLNPVRAGIVESADQYLWSSHRVYLGKVQQPWVETSFALRLFAPELTRARALYANFINEQVGGAPSFELRSHPQDSRVLGDDRFLAELASAGLRVPALSTLEQVAQEVCAETGMTISELQSPHRHRAVVDARAQLARRALAQRAASLSEVARFLNRSLSALARAVQRRSEADNDE